MATRMISKFAILAIVVCALLQNTDAQKTHVVGGDLGWTVPPGGPIVYYTWASLQDFDVGDILLFNFTNGDQDVAQVTREAFKICNTTNPISLKKTNPANFTLDTADEYYFTSTVDQHCSLGQKLAIYVSGPGPSPSPAPKRKPRGPVNFTVGDGLGWRIPPGGELAYAIWALGKTFMVGDALVFYYFNGTQDVAVVSKEAYEKCETNNTIAVYSNNPTRIILDTIGEHFYTSTYPQHCGLGQKLAINVTANTNSSSSGTGLSPAASGPSALAPASSAPPKALCGFMLTFSIAIAFFY